MRSSSSSRRWAARSTGPIADPRAIDAYARIADVPPALAQRTRDEFYPKEASQLAAVKGLELTLTQALEYKYITQAMTEADLKGLLDLLAVK